MAEHPDFSARPNYSALRSLSATTLRQQAAAELKAGRLNCTTLWLHRLCWQRFHHSKDLLNYALCRRQFGYPLGALRKRMERLARQPNWWLYAKGLRRHQVNQIRNLVNESQLGCRTNGPHAANFSQWLAQQPSWQQQWLDTLNAATTVHVVGNSPHILGQGLGAKIDAADVVIRFNHFKSEHTATSDIGSKISAWVVAPGYQGPSPELNGAPVILAGPAMLYMQQSLAHISDHLPAQFTLLHVPLEVWRTQVRRFAAPPSAGALLLGWLLHIQRHQQVKFSIKGFGFGYDATTQSRYHSAKPQHRPVERHNWAAEHIWMQSILSE